MARAMGLSSYTGLPGRARASKYAPSANRPRGQLIWAHATAAHDIAALLRLFERLYQQRPDVHLLLTHQGAPLPTPLPRALAAAEVVVPEKPDAVRSFLGHWRPDLCLWAHGNLRPVLLQQAAHSGMALVLVNAAESGFEAIRARWLPDPARQVLHSFRAVFAQDENTGQRLLRLGLPQSALHVVGPLQQASMALPHDPDAREELSTALTDRQVWLAAHVNRDGLATITEAHRAAMRYAHRMLLIVVPDDADDEPGFAATLDDEGWRVARWARGELPNETTQILLADGTDEMGLWYRLAPLTLMASTLHSPDAAQDPFAPAALGSAVVFASATGAHQAAYAQLQAAGAAVALPDITRLAPVVSELISPERAAKMALAAWQVISQGAAATDQVIELLQDRLDTAPPPKEA